LGGEVERKDRKRKRKQRTRKFPAIKASLKNRMREKDPERAVVSRVGVILIMNPTHSLSPNREVALHFCVKGL